MSAVKLPVRFSALNRSAVQSVGLRRGSAGGKSCFGRGGRGVLGQERGAESGEVCVGGGGRGSWVRSIWAQAGRPYEESRRGHRKTATVCHDGVASRPDKSVHAHDCLLDIEYYTLLTCQDDAVHYSLDATSTHAYAAYKKQYLSCTDCVMAI